VDLEEAPEWLSSFAEQQQTQHCDVVYGVQAKRKGKIWERLSGGVFYKLFNLLSGMSLPENITTARLMSRRYVNALLQHREREIYIAGLWHLTGFLQAPQIVTKTSKETTTYTFSKKVALLVNSLTAFSNAPLLGIFYLGLGIFCAAMSYTAYLIFKWYFLEAPPSGWTSLMASVWLLGGMMMLSTGIIGIYLSKVLSETKKRPYTLIRAIYKKHEK
jgi:putative glycosyltransferase